MILPDTISFLPSVVEALVGHVISLPVKMGVHISECHYHGNLSYYSYHPVR